jgi:hypothetical protein
MQPWATPQTSDTGNNYEDICSLVLCIGLLGDVECFHWINPYPPRNYYQHKEQDRQEKRSGKEIVKEDKRVK